MFKTGLLLGSLFMLSGCRQEPMDYDFLVTHPDAMEQALSRCQATPTEGADCIVVRRAANTFSELVNERSANPEEFGRKIIATQMKLAMMQKAAADAHGDQKQVIQKEYDQQRHDTEVLIAVVAATTNVSS
jgi:hypothetical protein